MSAQSEMSRTQINPARARRVQPTYYIHKYIIIRRSCSSAAVILCIITYIYIYERNYEVSNRF